MKELGITVNKILKDWLQSKGEDDIVFTDDIAINEVDDKAMSTGFLFSTEWLRFRMTCSEKPNNSQKTEGGAK